MADFIVLHVNAKEQGIKSNHRHWHSMKDGIYELIIHIGMI